MQTMSTVIMGCFIYGFKNKNMKIPDEYCTEVTLSGYGCRKPETTPLQIRISPSTSVRISVSAPSNFPEN